MQGVEGGEVTVVVTSILTQTHIIIITVITAMISDH